MGFQFQFSDATMILKYGHLVEVMYPVFTHMPGELPEPTQFFVVVLVLHILSAK